MLSFEDKISIEKRGNEKIFFARRLLKEFPNNANILKMSYKKTSLISHTDSFFC